MCGINGVAGMKDIDRARQIVADMNNLLAHRGPDDSGVFSDFEIAMGHRRLSIIDLTDAGKQPMFSPDMQYCISFNGEIYNYADLKKQLYDYPYSSQTDTEVILAAYKRWGTACLEKLDGMFAFAIWDKSKSELFIARDRIGIKPLYFFEQEGKLIFSSELRPILKSGFVTGELDYSGLVSYLRYQTVHAPYTIIKGIRMLSPGHFLLHRNGDTKIHEYWNMAKKNKYDKELKTLSYNKTKEKVSDLLSSAVKKRLMADVPLGAFLSGGIDSSIIVGLMSEFSSQKVNTFSVTFSEEEMDESKYARIIAKKFDTCHTEIRLQPRDFLSSLTGALDAMDHPSGDGPNTYVVSKVTREAGIVVALSGLGGDEIFAGYDVFKQLNTLQRRQWILGMPRLTRIWAGKVLKRFNSGRASTKITEVLALKKWDLSSTYPITRKVLHEHELEVLLCQDNLPSNSVEQILNGYNIDNNLNDLPSLSRISVAELSTYLQNVLLRDTDQMSMATSLEVRVPFLDHKLIEGVLSIPDKYKYPSTPKRLLVEATNGLLPDEIIDRPKMGFTLPWDNWLRNDLKNFSIDQLEKLGKRTEFNGLAIKQHWQLFLKNDPRISWSQIWLLVVLGYWLEKNNVA